MVFNLRNSIILFSLGTIILMGSLTIYSVTSIDINYFLRFLLINIFVILLVVLLFNQINLNRIFSFGWLLFLLNILLVLSVEIFGKEINGSKRWLDFGFLSLQPSEFMKITYALFVVQYLRFYSFKFSKFRTIFLLSVLFFSALPIIAQPDLGTGLVYIFLGLMFLFICGMHRFYFIGMGVFGVLLSPLIYTFGLTSYQKGRIISWFSSDQTLSEKWNILQSEISIGSGGLSGEGFLNSKQNEFNFLPEADTDFIFSIYLEETGAIGFLILFACYLVILWRLFKLAENAKNQNYFFNSLIITSFALLFFIQTSLNIFVNLGVIPTKGLTLPFISYGRSSVIMNFIALAITLRASWEFRNKIK